MICITFCTFMVPRGDSSDSKVFFPLAPISLTSHILVFFHLRNISRLRPSPPQYSTEVLIHALVTLITAAPSSPVSPTSFFNNSKSSRTLLPRQTFSIPTPRPVPFTLPQLLFCPSRHSNSVLWVNLASLALALWLAEPKASMS